MVHFSFSFSCLHISNQSSPDNRSWVAEENIVGAVEMENSQTNSPTTAIMELANMISVPMALNAVVRLNVADAIWQGGSNNPLSAAEILSAAAVGPGGDAENLQRILRLLTSFGVFEEHLNADATKRRYLHLCEIICLIANCDFH